MPQTKLSLVRLAQLQTCKNYNKLGIPSTPGDFPYTFQKLLKKKLIYIKLEEWGTSVYLTALGEETLQVITERRSNRTYK